jgi:DNA-binding NarL/FixJ family response regulator
MGSDAASPELPASRAQVAQRADGATGERLRPRDLMVLTMAAGGYGLGQICRLLAMTPERLEAHLDAAAQRLGAATMQDAIARARRRGLLD